MLALVVRFDLRDQAAAALFDELLATALPQIEQEPGTLIYLTHTVEDEPLVRVFYELYADRDAFIAHEAYEHTRRFLTAKDELLAGVRVEFLGEPAGAGIPPRRPVPSNRG